ncbi:MAG: phosphomethylpyrimidine synthase ThiC [Candidatus Omnitrophota bacterium]
MTQLEIAREMKISVYARLIAEREGVAAETVRESIANGRVVIPANRNRTIAKPCGIGEGLTTKVNANIGTSKDFSDLATELEKTDAAIAAGADTIMDLSTCPNSKNIRKEILARSIVPVGTVPIYETIVEGLRRNREIQDIPSEAFFETLQAQAEEGVDFFTIHAGVTKAAIETLKKHPRILDIVSRGGAILAEWIEKNNKENPFYSEFERVLSIAQKHDVTLSLGDGLRPGSIIDATDAAQVFELYTLGELQKRAVEYGVQVMIEGPGHVPIHQIRSNVTLQKSICNKAPFYVLGPLVTDIAPGYDHITGAIGGAIAASAGADFLCYVTPSEHVRLPSVEDVHEGVIASKIAAHAADISKGIKGAVERDRQISLARKARDWRKQFSLALDPEKPKKLRALSEPRDQEVCTMCSEFCSIRQAEKVLKR